MAAPPYIRESFRENYTLMHEGAQHQKIPIHQMTDREGVCRSALIAIDNGAMTQTTAKNARQNSPTQKSGC